MLDTYHDYCLVSMISVQTAAKVGAAYIKENIHGGTDLTKKVLHTSTKYKTCGPFGCSPCKERSTITSISSSMDEHTPKSGHISSPGYMGRRARAPTPSRYPSSTQPHLPALRSNLEGTRLLEHPQSRSHSSRPSSAHRMYPHTEHSPSPVPSSSSSGFTQPHVHEQTQDRPQRARMRDSVGNAPRARTSHSSPYPTSRPAQERLAATHRDSAGPQRSHRRHHNVAEKTHSTILPSGGMYMTFPLDIPSPEPDSEGGVPAGPPPFEHGPTELPPRPYETPRAELEGSGQERPTKRGRLPADVMDHLPTIEGRLHKIEVAVKDYLDERNKRALDKSILPGSQ
ncbi:hypothetical protein BJV78DRAFT_1185274 [Lactifluus subvellereus]|nr:hypothetical protein BJV78DRAFT_1185274 [Lactifluus subvellereus]